MGPASLHVKPESLGSGQPHTYTDRERQIWSYGWMQKEYGFTFIRFFFFSMKVKAFGSLYKVVTWLFKRKKKWLHASFCTLLAASCYVSLLELRALSLSCMHTSLLVLGLGWVHERIVPTHDHEGMHILYQINFYIILSSWNSSHLVDLVVVGTTPSVPKY